MKELLSNPTVLSVILAIIGYLAKCGISWLVNVRPSLKEYELEKKCQTVVALVDQWIKEQPGVVPKEKKRDKAFQIAHQVGVALDKVNVYRRMLLDG